MVSAQVEDPETYTHVYLSHTYVYTLICIHVYIYLYTYTYFMCIPHIYEHNTIHRCHFTHLRLRENGRRNPRRQSTVCAPKRLCFESQQCVSGVRVSAYVYTYIHMYIYIYIYIYVYIYASCIRTLCTPKRLRFESQQCVSDV